MFFNEILELELAGVVRYTHYSFMLFGPHRMPLVDWMRAQATESLLHANQAGELISGLGGHPSLEIGALLETHQHDIEQILRESLAHEEHALAAYRRLAELARCSERLEPLQRRARRSDLGVNTLIAFGAIAGQRPLPPFKIPNAVRPLVRASAAENR